MKYIVRVDPDALKIECESLAEARKTVKAYAKRWNKYAYIIREDGKRVE